MRRVNLAPRRVRGGFVQRHWLGDCWVWILFDKDMNRIPFTSRTLSDAKTRLAAMDWWKGDSNAEA